MARRQWIADQIRADRARAGYIGRPLLKPLVVSLLRHDGFLSQFQGSLLPGRYRSIGAREIAAAWRLLTGFYDKREADEKGREADNDFMKLGFSSVLYGHPQLIPIARDLGGGHIVLDHRTEVDRGRVHEAEAVEGVMRVSHEKWASLPALMEAIATSLEIFRPLNGNMPVVDEEQRLYWDYIPLRNDRAPHRS